MTISAINGIGFRAEQAPVATKVNIAPTQKPKEGMSDSTKLLAALGAVAVIGIATVAIMKGKGSKVVNKPENVQKPVSEMLQSRLDKAEKLVDKLKKRAVSAKNLVTKKGVVKTKKGKPFNGFVLKNDKAAKGLSIESYEKYVNGRKTEVYGFVKDKKAGKIKTVLVEKFDKKGKGIGKISLSEKDNLIILNTSEKGIRVNDVISTNENSPIKKGSFYNYSKDGQPNKIQQKIKEMFGILIK